jgi:hypothetical protein
MTNRFGVSSALIRRLEDVGLRPLVVLRQAGLPMRLFDQEKILLTTEELFSIYREISEVSRDPAIGLKLGTEEHIERYDPISIAALYAMRFRDALQRMARYKQLTSFLLSGLPLLGRQLTWRMASIPGEIGTGSGNGNKPTVDFQPPCVSRTRDIRRFKRLAFDECHDRRVANLPPALRRHSSAA